MYIDCIGILLLEILGGFFGFYLFILKYNYFIFIILFYLKIISFI